MRIRFRAIALFTFLLLVEVARADFLDSKDDERDVGLSVIDEVTIVELKSVSLLRFELAKADDQVFALYNELNSNDALDMICKKEARIGSQIKYRVCKSAYHREIESESASDALDGSGAFTSARAPAGHYDKVRENMAKLVAEDLELLRAVRQRAALREKISEQKKEKN